MDNKVEINYSALEQGRAQLLEGELKQALDLKTRGRVSNLRRAVLGAVKDGHYSSAKDLLGTWLSVQAEYPRFKARSVRYEQHCLDLIHTIDIKRNIDGLSSLSVAKQREVHERVLRHFEELKVNLKKLEQLEREVRLDDMRSTVIVVRSLLYSLTAIVVILFMIDFPLSIVGDLSILLDHWVTAGYSLF